MKRLLKRVLLAILLGSVLLQPLAGTTADAERCESAQHQCLCAETCTSPGLTAERCISLLPMQAQRTSAPPALFAEHRTRPSLPPPLPSRG